MSRVTVALLAALEAVVAALVGVGLAVVPLMLLWAAHFGMALDVGAFLRAACDVWLVGHGVDLTITIDAVTAERTGVPGAGEPFAITIALLGFGLLTLLSGRRIGRRSTAGGHAVVGGASAVLVLAAIGFGLGAVASHPAATHSAWQATLLPAATMALGVVIGSVAEGIRLLETEADGPAGAELALHPLVARIARLPRTLVEAVRASVRIGAGAAFVVIGVAAVLVTVLIVLDYATIVGLSQSLAAGVDGGIAIVVGELAFIPNLVVWAAAWLLGPGFAVGAGSTVSPTGTLLGPLPGVPILGIMPPDGVPFGALWLLVPLVAGFAGATSVWPRLAAAAKVRSVTVHAWWMPPAIAAGAGAVAGGGLGLVAWWSAGSIGPGRLSEVGPDALPVALMAALTIFLGSLAGAFTARALAHDDAAERVDAYGRVREREREPVGARSLGRETGTLDPRPSAAPPRPRPEPEREPEPSVSGSFWRASETSAPPPFGREPEASDTRSFGREPDTSITRPFWRDPPPSDAPPSTPTTAPADAQSTEPIEPIAPGPDTP